MRKGFEPKTTLCWDCAKACGECSWSNHWDHSPVPGLKAEQTYLKVNGGDDISYRVIECPEFEPDGRKWNGPG